MVIGGGLLGLEAANALNQFGLRTHVIEMMPRLMAQQIDEAGGAAAGQDGHRARDRRCTSGREPSRLNPLSIRTARLSVRVRLTDGSKNGKVIDAGVVIFAAGIRPRDELARAAG